jgi:hypothetical protein
MFQSIPQAVPFFCGWLEITKMFDVDELLGITVRGVLTFHCNLDIARSFQHCG